MAIFTGKINDAYYHSEDYGVIKIEIKDEERDIIFPHFIEADPNDGEYQALLEEGYDEETLIERTVNYKRQASFQLNNLVDRAAERRAQDLANVLAEQVYNQKVRVEAAKIVQQMLSDKRDELERIRKEKDFLVDEKDQLLAQKNNLKDEETMLSEILQQKEQSIVSLDQAFKQQKVEAQGIIFDFIFEKNRDKEELFKAKLWALEREVVQNAPKEIKSKIRKTNKITQLFEIIDGLMEE